MIERWNENENQKIIIDVHHNLFVTLLLESKPISKLCYKESKMYSYIGKLVFNTDHWGSSTDPYYIQNNVTTNRVIKRLRFNLLWFLPIVIRITDKVHIFDDN